MRADLLFRKGEYTQAAQHFQELLGRNPGSYYITNAWLLPVHMNYFVNFFVRPL